MTKQTTTQNITKNISVTYNADNSEYRMIVDSLTRRSLVPIIKDRAPKYAFIGLFFAGVTWLRGKKGAMKNAAESIVYVSKEDGKNKVRQICDYLKTAEYNLSNKTDYFRVSNKNYEIEFAADLKIPNDNPDPSINVFLIPKTADGLAKIVIDAINHATHHLEVNFAHPSAENEPYRFHSLHYTYNGRPVMDL